jgi:hypothetical protein
MGVIRGGLMVSVMVFNATFNTIPDIYKLEYPEKTTDLPVTLDTAEGLTFLVP